MSIEDTFAKFQKNFETVTLTLIAEMNKISERLQRVNESMDLTEKIRIQNSENLQSLSHLEKQVKALVARLDKMSVGGFQIPEAPIPSSAPAAPSSAGMDLLNATFTGKSSEPDDLEKEFGPLPENQISPSVNQSTPVQSIPALDVVTEKIDEDILAPKKPTEAEIPEIPKAPAKMPPPITKIPPTPIMPPTPVIPISKPNPVPSNPTLDIPAPIPRAPVPPIPVAPVPVVPTSMAPSNAGLPSLTKLPKAPGSVQQVQPESVINASIGPNTLDSLTENSSPQDFFNALIAELEKCKKQGEAGDLIVKVKETLSRKIQFNPSYFEMFMYGASLKAKKDIPFGPDILIQAKEKIKVWRQKF